MTEIVYFWIFVAVYSILSKIYRHWKITKAFVDYGTRAEYRRWRETGKGVDMILTRKFIEERDSRYR